MKTTNFPVLNARCATIALIAVGLGLAGLPARAQTAGPVKLDDAKLDEFSLERTAMFEITPPAKKLTLAAAAKDPLAAERVGLWVIAGKGPARKISLDDARKDPLAAERAGLWDVVAAKKGCVLARK